MNRLSFLKRASFPVAAGAALAARRLDPDGEPVPETAPLIVVDAPNTVLRDMVIHGGAPRRTAIQFTEKAMAKGRRCAQNIAVHAERLG